MAAFISQKEDGSGAKSFTCKIYPSRVGVGKNNAREARKREIEESGPYSGLKPPPTKKAKIDEACSMELGGSSLHKKSEACPMEIGGSSLPNKKSLESRGSVKNDSELDVDPDYIKDDRAPWPICSLSAYRKVSVRLKGIPYVNIEDFWKDKSGKLMRRCDGGIKITEDQWKILKAHSNVIDKALEEIKE